MANIAYLHSLLDLILGCLYLLSFAGVHSARLVISGQADMVCE
jgi:hypothetical protein